jgi:hypothetical protein
MSDIRYISTGEWYDAGTEAYLLDDYRPQGDCGLFIGIKDGKVDEEVCAFDEFLKLGRHSE